MLQCKKIKNIQRALDKFYLAKTIPLQVTTTIRIIVAIITTKIIVIKIVLIIIIIAVVVIAI